MGTFLFGDVVFGPVYSRRLGHSLGINLLPGNKKICSFNCIYCECGWTDSNQSDFIDAEDFRKILDKSLSHHLHLKTKIDSVTFAGNGEPTLHPEFNVIIDITNQLKSQYYPNAKTTVLSNSTTLDNQSVFESLKKVNNIMKLDTGIEETFQLLNQPNYPITLEQIVSNLKNFSGNLTIQTLLLRGSINGMKIDNSSETEIKMLIEKIRDIQPHTMMLYTVARSTPAEHITKLSEYDLQIVAKSIQESLPNLIINVYP